MNPGEKDSGLHHVRDFSRQTIFELLQFALKPAADDPPSDNYPVHDCRSRGAGTLT